MARIPFYLVEALLLASVACAGFVMAVRGLRRLGWEQPLNWLRVFLVIWAALFVLGILGGEFRGPEFLAAYHAVGYSLVLAAGIWLASFPLSKYVRVTASTVDGAVATKAGEQAPVSPARRPIDG
jgi:hypothetical protein